MQFPMEDVIKLLVKLKSHWITVAIFGAVLRIVEGNQGFWSMKYFFQTFHLYNQLSYFLLIFSIALLVMSFD